MKRFYCMMICLALTIEFYAQTFWTAIKIGLSNNDVDSVIDYM
jgi:hypothetical protein